MAITRSRQNNAWLLWLPNIRVDEIHILPILDTIEERTNPRFRFTDPIPPHLRHLELARFRINLHRERSRAAAAVRMLPAKVPRLASLDLPPQVELLAQLPRGLAQADVAVLPAAIRTFAQRFLAVAYAPLRIVETGMARLSGGPLDHAVPAAGQVWWRSAIRARAEASRAAASPMVWLQALTGAGAAGAPQVVLFHGLEGSSTSHYASAFMHALRERGWNGSVVHFRGCSGEPNRLARAYHSGDADEIDWIVRAPARAIPAPHGLSGPPRFPGCSRWARSTGTPGRPSPPTAHGSTPAPRASA